MTTNNQINDKIRCVTSLLYVHYINEHKNTAIINISLRVHSFLNIRSIRKHMHTQLNNKTPLVPSTFSTRYIHAPRDTRINNKIPCVSLLLYLRLIANMFLKCSYNSTYTDIFASDCLQEYLILNSLPPCTRKKLYKHNMSKTPHLSQLCRNKHR